MTCPSCGATIASGATSCAARGATVTGGGPSPISGGHAPSPPNPDDPPGGSGHGPPPTTGDGGFPREHPSGLSNETRNWALATHLSAFLGAWLLLSFVGPLAVWLAKREEHPFIDHHGREALNFNLSVLFYRAILVVVAIPIGLLTLGLGVIPLAVLGLALAVAWIVLTVIASTSASNGESYRYPLTIRFVP